MYLILPKLSITSTPDDQLPEPQWSIPTILIFDHIYSNGKLPWPYGNLFLPLAL